MNGSLMSSTMGNLKVHATDATYVANLWGSYSSTNDVFEADDAGESLTVMGGTNFAPNDYAVERVFVPLYTDLAIDASDNTKVSSQRRPFIASDVGFELKIIDGTGFNLVLLTINSIDGNGVATLSGSAGTVGSTGGQAAVTPYAKLDSAPANAGSTGGTGYVGAIEVHETQGICRALGIDDLGDPVNHLAIHASDNTKISNAGTVFTSDDDDKIITIEGGSGLHYRRVQGIGL